MAIKIAEENTGGGNLCPKFAEQTTQINLIIKIIRAWNTE